MAVLNVFQLLAGHEHQNAESGVIRVVQVVVVINVLNVAIVVVRPLRWPWLGKLESVTGVEKFRLRLIDDAGALYVEVMLASKAGTESLLRNPRAAMISGSSLLACIPRMIAVFNSPLVLSNLVLSPFVLTPDVFIAPVFVAPVFRTGLLLLPDLATVAIVLWPGSRT